MRKAAWILLVVVLFVGCSNQQPVVQPDTGSNQMEEPMITVHSHHTYYGSSGLGRSYALSGDSIAFPGDGFSIAFEFSEPIDVDSFIANFRVEGYDAPQVSAHEKGANIWVNLPYATPNQAYTVHLGEGIEKVGGGKLGRDLVYTLRQDSHPKAYFTLAGRDGTYKDIGDLWAPEGDFGWPNQFTTNPKTFIIDFTEEVDQASVEAALSQAFGQSVNLIFNWQSGTTLELLCKGLEPGNEYHINLENATDKRGYPVLGALFFTTGLPKEIRVLDLDSMESTLLRELPDKLYIPKPSHSVERYLLFTDGIHPLLINVQDGTMSSYEQIPHWVFRWDNRMLDAEHLVYVDNEQRKMMTISLADGSIKELFGLESMQLAYSSSVAVSPSRDKVLLITGASEVVYGVHILSLQGELLYSQAEVFRSGGYGYWLHNVVRAAWLDDERIVFEDMEQQMDGDKVIQEVNVVDALNIVTGERTTVSRNATLPEVMRTGVLKYEKISKDGHYTRTAMVQLGDLFIEVPHAGDPFSHNFFLLKDNVLTFARGEDVVLYDLTGRSPNRVVGRGEVIGVSADGNKLYYLTLK